MNRKKSFRPQLTDELEPRVVLSKGVHPSASVLVSGLMPRLQALGKHRAQPIFALVNTSFDSFVSDYTQARGAYLSSLSTAGSDSKAAFESYTQNRVNLLAQQLVSTILQTPMLSSKQHGAGSALPGLVVRKINGPDRDTPANVFQRGTLGRDLLISTPSATASAASASLSSLSQDQAIESARVSIINGLNIVKSGYFGNKSSK